MRTRSFLSMALACLGLISCGSSGLGLRTGATFQLPGVDELSSYPFDLAPSVADESYPLGGEIGLTYRQRISGGFETWLEPTLRFAQRAEIVLERDFRNVQSDPYFVTIATRHSTIDLPLTFVYALPDVVGELEGFVGVGPGIHLEPLSEQTDGSIRPEWAQGYGFNYGYLTTPKFSIGGLVGLGYRLSDTWSIAADLRYRRSVGDPLEARVNVQSRSGGETYLYRQTTNHLGLSVAAILRL